MVGCGAREEDGDGPSDHGRRAAFLGALAAGGILHASPAAGATSRSPDAQPSAAEEIWLRLLSDPSGSTTFAVTEGTVWGFRPQADDLKPEAFAMRLYGYRSLAARRLGPASGGGWALTSKAWSFYVDLDTDRVTGALINPYTGERVACPALSSPVSQVVYGRAGSARPSLRFEEKAIGTSRFLTAARTSRFRPGDATWFKLETDITSYVYAATTPANTFLNPTWSHNLVAEWQTWMHMHGFPGHILFRGDGAFVASAADAPHGLAEDIERAFPASLAAVDGWRS